MIPGHSKAVCYFYGVCAACPGALNIGDREVCQWTSGWVLNRDAGGGHSQMLPRRAKLWAHRRCIEEVGKGTAGQLGFALASQPKHELPWTPSGVPSNAHFDEEGRLIHEACEVCGKPAGFSVETSLKDGLLGRWFCREHVPGGLPSGSSL